MIPGAGKPNRGAVTPQSSKVKRASSNPLSPGRAFSGARLAVVPQSPTLPKGFRLFKIRQSKRQNWYAQAAVAEDGDAIEAEFLSGTIKGVHHVALLTEDLDASLEFYVGVLGLDVNRHRPHDKLPYRGAWLNIGPEMIHLMELPNPDKFGERPEHGGRDRHFCIGLDAGAVEPLAARLEQHGVKYTKSKSGRPAIFFRDPDDNCLEAVEINHWR